MRSLRPRALTASLEPQSWQGHSPPRRTRSRRQCLRLPPPQSMPSLWTVFQTPARRLFLHRARWMTTTARSCPRRPRCRFKPPMRPCSMPSSLAPRRSRWTWCPTPRFL
eukprot:Amastigsp_a2651_67.p2 type:complete len:109 gc:universal Amastigsp_a2651_67:740-1066(+)